MKTKTILIFSIICFFAGCSKEHYANKNIQGRVWLIEKYYVNDVDSTDTLLNRIGQLKGLNGPGNLIYSFADVEGREHSLEGDWGSGIWYINDNGNILDITVTQTESAFDGFVGPLLAKNINIKWDLNYDKLCDNKLWITTNYNSRKYEVHFRSS